MMSAWTASSSSFWTRRYCMLRNSCLSILGSLLITLVFTIVTIQLAVKSHDTKEKTLESRQFQLGGVLGGNFVQALRLEQGGHSAAAQSSRSSTSTSNSYIPEAASMGVVTSASSSTSESGTIMQETAQDTTNTKMSYTTMAATDLLSALVKALTPILGLHNTSPTSDFGRRMVLTMADAMPTATGQTLILAPSSSTNAGAHHIQDKSLTASVWAETLQKHAPYTLSEIVAPKKRDVDPYDQEAELALFLLDHVSILIVNVAMTSVSLAARLTDATLAALPVNAAAISSVVSAVAGQGSVSIESIIPLILPAVAAILGKQVKLPTSNTKEQDSTGTYETIVTRGSLIINQIVAASVFAQTPLMQDVLSQVVDIVYATSTKLNQTMCALKLAGIEFPWEVVLPCASIDAKSASSATVLTFNPTGVTTRGSNAPSAETAGWNINPGARAELDTLLSYVTTSAYHSDAASAPDGTTSYAQTSSSRLVIATCDVMEVPTSSSSVTSADSMACSMSTVTPTLNTPLEVGPCPKRGYPCKDCLNGWFCPPQETPPQVVPCGLGWPCYHCTSGYFCSSTSLQGTAHTLGTSTSYPSRTGTLKPGPEITMSTFLPRPDGEAHTGIPGWTYLGCFQDDISRVLVGSKPLDYLRGPMSRSKCISHCQAGGYSFAGTEYGCECWCGSSIRDDAVRLPESSCNVSCHDAGDEVCGGSWVISVFRCSDEGTLPKDDGGLAPSTVGGRSSYQFPSLTSTIVSTQSAQPSEAALSSISDARLYTSSSCTNGVGGRETAQVTYQGPVAQLLAEARHPW
ncbi:hypothetical protein C2857_007554 [Epichloe festucae Fl1]|uniref:WSC domain-containing protein n=1 Tax=Epichloe festucae (strain Fl1) TaxID=877507 RepID=A0A7S9PT39_EPIFF|nr:hypothetical protein C2857_007554 [Epichloe festucae Fl1]